MKKERAAKVPVTRPYIFRKANLICGSELLALLAFFEDHAPSPRWIRCWVYLGNINCLSAPKRGCSNTEIVAVIVARFRRLARRYNICVWFPRVKRKINPPGISARGERAPDKAGRRTSFRPLGPRFHLIRTPLLNGIHSRPPKSEEMSYPPGR